MGLGGGGGGSGLGFVLGSHERHPRRAAAPRPDDKADDPDPARGTSVSLPRRRPPTLQVSAARFPGGAQWLTNRRAD